MKISMKFALGASLLTVLAIVISAGATAYLALQQSSQALQHSVEQQFLAVASGRENAVRQRLSGDTDMLLSLANSRQTQEAVYGFIRPFVSYRYEVETPAQEELLANMQQWYHLQYQPLYQQQTAGEQAAYQQWLAKTPLEGLLLQQYYVRDNPHPADKLGLLEDRGDASIYGQQHRRYQSSYREVVERYGYHDLMLVDAASLNVIYSVNKGPAFATSLKNGAFADSALAELAVNLQQQPGSGVQISRFSEFSGFFKQQVVFVGVPVTHPVYSPDKALGFLIAQLPASLFTELMTGAGQWQDIGLGQTGEAFLVSAERRLVTELRPMLEQQADLLSKLTSSAIVTADFDRARRLGRLSGLLTFDSAEINAGLAGEASLGQRLDYLGRDVLMAWQPLQIGEQPYVLVTQQLVTENLGAINQLQRQLLLSVIIAVLVLGSLAAFAAAWLARYLTAPFGMLSNRIIEAGKSRNLTVQFSSDSADEVADIGRALNSLFNTFAGVIEQLKQHAQLTAHSATHNVEISQQCNTAAGQQQQSLLQISNSADAVMRAMQQMSDDMTRSAQQAKQTQAGASEGAQAVSEVASSMRELAVQVADSGLNMQALQEAASDISSVVDTIRGVSEQTNLLALNAAIEAARAGEHGRGFAVVADEVRRLSANTSSATQQIQQMLDRLRLTVEDASQTLQQEQLSAQRCVESSERAEQTLARIRQDVQAISTATEQVTAMAIQENKRMAQMGQALGSVGESAAITGEAMAKLATTAQQQEQLALQMQQSAAVFRL